MAVWSRETKRWRLVPALGGGPGPRRPSPPAKPTPRPPWRPRGAAGALPVESWVGSGFISLSTIFWYKALRLNGSTVKGRVPVSMAYMFTPLREPEREQSEARRAGPGHLPVLSLPRTF